MPIFWHFNIYNQEKFHAQSLVEHEKKFYNLGAWHQSYSTQLSKKFYLLINSNLLISIVVVLIVYFGRV